MKTNSTILIWLATAAIIFRSDPSGTAQTQAPEVKRANSPAQGSDTKHASTRGSATVVRDSVPGSFLSPNTKLERIIGRVTVVNAHTLAFDDGTEVELNGGMDAPELEQKGLIGDKLYPCGKEAAEFLRKLIGEQRV